ncbi:MAG: transcription termination factor NusA [bacterium]
METSLTSAIQQICDEKGISIESVVETIEAALAAAYRKDYGAKNQNIKVKFNLNTGDFEVYDEKIVVDKPVVEDNDEEIDAAGKASFAKVAENKEKTQEEIEEEKAMRLNPKTEIQLEEALKSGEAVKEGDIIKTPLEVHTEFGRMASQTAKQVIIQKLREAERQTLYDEFKRKEKEILIGVVQRPLGKNWLIDLGKVSAILPREERIPYEEYKQGAKMKFYILSVSQTSKGPEIILSRAHPEILKKLFVLEIPEISSDVVEIKSLAREAGSRSKLAVIANDENVDPIGACVGQRGARIQTIINEIGGEKVDIILYNDDIKKFIANSLSPAKVLNVEIDERMHIARVLVNEDQLSLAIGKAGQNVRLAAKLTGWKINIKSVDGKEFTMEEAEGKPAEIKAEEAKIEESPTVTAEEEIKEEVKDKTSEEAKEEVKEEAAFDKKEKVKEEKKIKKEKKEKKKKN